MENKDKINFDLDFLDKNTKEKPKHNPNTSKDPNWVFHDGNKSNTRKAPVPASGGMSDTAKKWAWGIGIFIVLAIIGSLSDSSSSSTPSTSSNTYQPTTSASDGSVRVGQYWCSSYAASHADSIEPSATEKNALDIQATRVKNAGDARKVEKASIENEYVDETDQYAIDEHNARIDSYNNRYQTYSDDYDDYERKLAAYNQKVDTYNNYLTSNCRPN
jgi:hypothetical protein